MNDKNKHNCRMVYVKLGNKYIYDKYTMLKSGQGVEKRPNKIKENEINGTNSKKAKLF